MIYYRWNVSFLTKGNNTNQGVLKLNG